MELITDCLSGLAHHRAGWWITAAWMLMHMAVSPLAFIYRGYLGSASFFCALSATYYTIDDAPNEWMHCTYGLLCIAYFALITRMIFVIRKRVAVRAYDLSLLLRVAEDHKEDLPHGFIDRMRDTHGLPSG